MLFFYTIYLSFLVGNSVLDISTNLRNRHSHCERLSTNLRNWHNHRERRIGTNFSTHSTTATFILLHQYNTMALYCMTLLIPLRPFPISTIRRRMSYPYPSINLWPQSSISPPDPIGPFRCHITRQHAAPLRRNDHAIQCMLPIC